MAHNKEKIVIIGAGPTGLGAGWRLFELGHQNWTLVDAAPDAGGLANSVVDDKGFIWDLGGHVIFSHYEYFDKLLNFILGEDWVCHIRESWVWMRDRWIPYPLQNNIWRLPEKDLIHCLNGLVDVTKTAGTKPRPANFHQWILDNMGEGLADTFMVPYNFKVWAYHPREMGVGWMGERVATVDLKRILNNLVQQKDELSWGPNAKFRFPLRGGTGAIWKGLASKLPQERIRYGKSVTSIDTTSKTIHYSDGSSESYDKILSTMPLDLLLKLTNIPSKNDYLRERAGRFLFSASHIIGVGVEGKVPEDLKTKCWMYFPEDDSPFYRVTVFSNYSPHNVPKPGEQWSLMCEVSESPRKPVDINTVVEDTVRGLIKYKMLPADAKILSRWHTRLEHGYPTPFAGRDELLDEVQPTLLANNIWSRGRFGGWKYEVANQDHSCMQGVEAVDNMLFGTEETTYRFPNVVNNSKGAGRAPIIPPAASSSEK
jgi:protoporphyrinogen oxidase